MSDRLEELQQLKTRVADAERRRAKRQADIDSMEGRLRENLQLLKKEYGVASVAEAKFLLTELEEQLSNDIDALTKALQEEQA